MSKRHHYDLYPRYRWKVSDRLQLASIRTQPQIQQGLNCLAQAHLGVARPAIAENSGFTALAWGRCEIPRVNMPGTGPAAGARGSTSSRAPSAHTGVRDACEIGRA